MFGLPDGRQPLGELFARYGRADSRLPSTHHGRRPGVTPPILAVPDGEYVWEDYAEHDGVDDPSCTPSGSR